MKTKALFYSIALLFLVTLNQCKKETTTPAGTACFTPSSTSVNTGTAVTFTNCTNGGTAYIWSFGDGTSSVSTSPSHTYNTAGTYTVTLTATSSSGVTTKTATITVTTRTCSAGFEGANCTTEIRTKFLGAYQGFETCDLGNDSYTLTVAVNADITKVTISNLYNSGYTAIGTVSGTSITVPSQTVSAGVTASGTGTISGNTLTFTYAVTANGNTSSCTYTGTKL